MGSSHWRALLRNVGTSGGWEISQLWHLRDLWQGTTVQAATGFDHSEGKFGATEATTVVSVPLDLRAQLGDVRIKARLPYTDETGETDATNVRRRAAVFPTAASASHPVSRRCSVGYGTSRHAMRGRDTLCQNGAISPQVTSANSGRSLSTRSFDLEGWDHRPMVR